MKEELEKRIEKILTEDCMDTDWSGNGESYEYFSNTKATDLCSRVAIQFAIEQLEEVMLSETEVTDDDIKVVTSYIIKKKLTELKNLLK